MESLLVFFLMLTSLGVIIIILGGNGLMLSIGIAGILIIRYMQHREKNNE